MKRKKKPTSNGQQKFRSSASSENDVSMRISREGILHPGELNVCSRLSRRSCLAGLLIKFYVYMQPLPEARLGFLVLGTSRNISFFFDIATHYYLYGVPYTHPTLFFCWGFCNFLELSKGRAQKLRLSQMKIIDLSLG